MSFGVCGCIWLYLGVYGYMWVYLGLFGCIWVYMGVCGCMGVWGVWGYGVYAGVYRCMWVYVGVCVCIWVYVGVWVIYGVVASVYGEYWRYVREHLMAVYKSIKVYTCGVYISGFRWYIYYIIVTSSDCLGKYLTHLYIKVM